MAQETFGGIPRVSLAALQSQVVTNEWETAVEKLSLALCKHHVCVLTLPEPLKSDIIANLKLFGVLLSNATCFAMLSMLSKDEAIEGQSPVPQPMPGVACLDFRLGTMCLENMPEEVQKFIGEAYGRMDSIARSALAAICRSCHVRLRSDTFMPILDEFPLARGCLSSSVLRTICHGSEVGSHQRPGTPWRAPHEVSGSSHKGMLALVTSEEAVDSRRGPLSKLQVKGPDGRWEDVPLAPGEVAVMLGHTATRATAGLLQPAVYRVVGEAMSGSGRKAMEYHLLAKPDAVLNFHDAMLEAGHLVPDKFTTPVLMKELMRQFDSVLTPLSRSASGPASTSTGSIEFATLAKDALQMRNRKRLSSLTLPASTEGSPVTRSGKVRRTSGNLVSNRRSSAGGADAAEGEPPVEAARVFITVDGAGKRTSHFMRVAVKNEVTGLETWLRLAPSTKCGRLFEVYCETMGLDLGSVAFMFNGQRLFGFDLPKQKGLSDDCHVTVRSVEPKVWEVVNPAEGALAQAESAAEAAASPSNEHAEEKADFEVVKWKGECPRFRGIARRERLKANDEELAKQQAKEQLAAGAPGALQVAGTEETMLELAEEDPEAEDEEADDVSDEDAEPQRHLDMLQCTDTLDDHDDDNKENQP